MSRSIPDARERQAIEQRLDQTFLVEAGAGSGKTTSLVNRMLALIVTGTCSVQQIAAVTFTRKAAAELRERFQIKLEQALADEREPQVRRRLEQALSNLHRLFIGTVHSFCAHLLRERPVEAGLTPDFAELEEWEEVKLARQAWNEYLEEARTQRPGELEELAALDIRASELQSIFSRLVLHEDVQFVAAAASEPDPAAVIQALDDFCARAAPFLPADCPPKGWDPLQKLIRQWQHWRQLFDFDEPRTCFRLLEQMDRGSRVVQNRWTDKAMAKQLAERYAELKEGQLQPFLQQVREFRYQPLMRFLLPAVQRFHQLRQQESSLNYQDLLLLVRDLLRDHPDVRAYFQRKYTHLLVDEFQDTDPVQAEIMLYLTGTDLHEVDYTQLRIRPGSLFVVGDPKQSIYRFRRADIEIYQLVKQLIVESGGEVLQLSANFRSLESVVSWVNQSFGQLFGESSAPYQADYVPMHSIRTPGEGTTHGVMRLDLPEGLAQGEIVAADARTSAAWVAWALENLRLDRTDQEQASGVSPAAQPEDFLLLVRYKRDMAVYGQALAARGIPFTISGGGDMAGCRELNELLTLCQALLDPDDQVALVATLRGLLFGISDDDLQRYRAAGGHFNFLRDLPDSLDAPLRTVFEPAWEALRRFWAWSTGLPPSSSLERILASTGLLPWAHQFGTAGSASYLLQAVEMLRTQEQKELSSFAAAVEWLQVLQANGGVEDELDLGVGAVRGVRIMNLHKAKGLEAPVVILANPSRRVNVQPDLHVRRRGGQAEGFVCLQRQRGLLREPIAQPLHWPDLQDEESKYQRAEEVRLLYVAATRAKNLLVITCCPRYEARSPWQPLHAFLEQNAELSAVHSGREDQAAAAAVAWSEARLRLEQQRRVCAQPSYRVVRGSDLAGGDQPEPERVATGRGMAWGNVVHRALQELLHGTDLSEQLLRRLLADEGLASSQTRLLADTLQAVLDSELWQRVCCSPVKYAEAPFGEFVAGQYLTGTIDLVFQEGDGWVIVDYKSDTILSEDHMQQLIAYYAPQVQFYRRCWERISGEPVRACYILWVAEGSCTVTLIE
jgi:ATP-dependent helicase/nuclease subunit A